MGKGVIKKLCIPQFEITDKYDCLLNHGITQEDVLELCGGIPVEGSFELKCKIKSSSQFYINVVIESSIYECERSIDFEKKVIRNDSLCVEKKGEGTGTQLFINQLLAARKFGFKLIKLHATGGDAPPEWNGYYTYGRFGFTMEAVDQAIFDISMRQDGRFEKTLDELLSTGEGRAYWEENGVGWAGKFDTDVNSKNSTLFNDYLVEKGLDTL